MKATLKFMMIFALVLMGCSSPSSGSVSTSSVKDYGDPDLWTGNYFDGWILVFENFLTEVSDKPYAAISLQTLWDGTITTRILPGSSKEDLIRRLRAGESGTRFGSGRLDLSKRQLHIWVSEPFGWRLLLATFNNYDLSQGGILSDKDGHDVIREFEAIKLSASKK